MATNQLSGDVHAHSLLLRLADAGASNLELGQLVIEPFTSTLGNFEIRAQKLTLDNVVVHAERGPGKRATIAASAAALSGVEVALLDRERVPAKPLARVTIGTVELPRGFQLGAGSEVVIPELVAEDAAVSCEDILQLPAWLRAGLAAAADPTDRKAVRQAALAARRVDQPPPRVHDDNQRLYGFLDVVDGKLDIDLVIDLSIAVLGRCSETHKFRVPIQSGTFDFVRLEGNASWLVRSVLDIEVANGRLYLEKDIPLVPFDNKTIIYWPLDPTEQALAAHDRTRLRTMLKWHLLPLDLSKKLPLELHRITVRNIEIALALSRPATIDLAQAGRIRLGHDNHPGIEGLSVRGELHQDMKAPLPETTLHLTIKVVRAGLDACRIGQSTVDVESIELQGIDDVSLWFSAFQPNRLSGAIGRLALRGLRVLPTG